MVEKKVISDVEIGRMEADFLRAAESDLNQLKLYASTRGSVSYPLKEEFIPANEVEGEPVAPSAPAPAPKPSPDYLSALSNAHSAISLAISLLRQEQFRTPTGTREWNTLGGLAGEGGTLMERVYAEIEKGSASK